MQVSSDPNPYQSEFAPFPKMARYSREAVVTEKIDGTNGQILINDFGQMFTGSRTRWITPQDDNYGFAKWVEGNKSELLKLGPGRHFGEWWGSKIQRAYGFKNGERFFSLFNVRRWAEHGQIVTKEDGTVKEQLPACCRLVPVVVQGIFGDDLVNSAMLKLGRDGSLAAPGFMDPEGIIVFHINGQVAFKKTIVGDEKPKSLA